MHAGLSIRLLAACSLVAFASTVGARGQDPPADAKAEKEKLQRWDRQFQESLNWYQLAFEKSPGVTFRPQPVLRWTNAIRSQEGEPTLIFWINAGRPEALASVYPWSGNLIYECVSLSRDRGLIAREQGRTIWSPRSAGVTFREIPDSPTPAESPSRRLQQAKMLSERFKAAITPTNADGTGREELRLLPKPIYRYEMTEAKAAHPELIDGAAFAFAQGTDPEAVLLIEAVSQGGKPTWQYAFGRSTSYPIEARLGPSVVWTASGVNWNDPRESVQSMGRRLVD